MLFDSDEIVGHAVGHDCLQYIEVKCPLDVSAVTKTIAEESIGIGTDYLVIFYVTFDKTLSHS